MAIDLHVHPLADWIDDPTDTIKMDRLLDKSAEKILLRAKKEGLQAIAVTDHNIVYSIPRMTQLGEEHGIEVIPGVELNLPVLHHVLIYYPDEERLAAEVCNGDFSRLKESFKQMFYVKLNDKGKQRWGNYPDRGQLDYSYYLKFMDGQDQVDLFRNMLDGLRRYSGVIVKAHNFDLREEYEEDQTRLVSPLIAAGIDGFEVYTPKHTQQAVKYLEDTLIGTRCVMTGGSDAHHPNNVGYIRLYDADTITRVSYQAVEELKARRSA